MNECEGAGDSDSAYDLDRECIQTDFNHRPVPLEQNSDSPSTMSELTHQLVCYHTGTFDTSSIMTLTIRHSGLTSVAASLFGDGATAPLAGLLSIDLAHNRFTNALLAAMSAPGRLQQLKQLNLSHNNIDSLASFTGALPSLTSLRLEGNRIASVDGLQRIAAGCPKLRALYLQTLSHDDANPVCRTQRYRSDVLSALPRLLVLDGERMAFADDRLASSNAAAFYAQFAELDRDTAQYDSAGSSSSSSSQSLTRTQSTSLTSKPNDDWLANVAPMTHLTPAAFDSELAPRVSALRASLAECTRVATSDSDKMMKDIASKYPSIAAAVNDDAADVRGDAAARRDSDFGTFAEE